MISSDGNKPHADATASAPAALSALLEQALPLHQRGDLTQARTLYEQVLAINPQHADALHLLGVVAYQNQDFHRAIALIGRALEHEPNYADAHLNLGNAQQALKQWDAALASFERVIALKPDYAAAYFNRGNALQALQQHDAALTSYDRALALAPGYVEAHNNRGNTLRDLYRLNEARASYERAISRNAGHASAHRNLGVVLQDLGHYDAAIASYTQAIALAADDVKAHHNLGLCRLLTGDFARGWHGYEWRLKGEPAAPSARRFSQPAWLGKEPLVGKTILLHCEQGLGDTLQFCRYVKRVSDLGAQVILQVQRPLLSLLNGSPMLAEVAQIMAQDNALPPFDYHCPLASLPLAFATDIHSIPASHHYLVSSPIKVAAWQARLGPKTRPRIGLTWSGNDQFYGDDRRSIALADFVKLLPSHEEDHFEFICLQKEIRSRDRQTLRSRPDILFVGDALHDFSDTAALCECVDLVVSTCTSVPHLACALGKPTWLLLSATADWRWLLDRADSPWYPTAKLYRQNKLGDWNDVFARVASDLVQQFRHGPP